MKFGSVREAIHYAFNYQLMTPENDLAKLWCRVQFTVKGGSGATWMGMEMGDMLRPFNHLPVCHKNWVLVAYAGDGHYSQNQYDSIVIYALMNSTLKSTFLELITDPSGEAQEAREEMVTIAKMAVDDFIMRDFTGRNKYRQSDYCRAVGAHHSHYTRRLRQIVIAVTSALSKLAAESVNPFEEKLQQEGDVAA